MKKTDDTYARRPFYNDTLVTETLPVTEPPGVMQALDEIHVELQRQAAKLDRLSEERESFTGVTSEGDVVEKKVTISKTPFGTTLYDLLILGCIIVGVLGASGELDRLAVGGLALGPILAAFKKYVETNVSQEE